MTSLIINNILSGISSGLSNFDILASSPCSISLNTVDRIREAYSKETFGKKIRDIHVTYIDDIDAGLKHVYSKYTIDSICRISDYSRNFRKIYFNNYHGEPVIIFDNFNSDIPVETFVSYFRNGYPLDLPARGYTRSACYTKVFILSNRALISQYPLSGHNISPYAHILMDNIDTYLSVDAVSGELVENPIYPNINEGCL